MQNRLTTSINAEKRLDDTLQDINFTVISLENVAEEDEMMERTIAFTRKFKNGDIIVFYFSGHGSQYDGNNYLIPTNDTTITSEQDVEVFGVNVKRMVDRLTERKPDCVFILIFDCCRSYSLNRGSTATTSKFCILHMTLSHICMYLFS